MGLPDPVIDSFRIREGTPLVVRSRVTDADGAKVLKASISSLTAKIYDITSGLNQIVTPTSVTLVVADSWNDSYSTTGWAKDQIGWNVSCVIPASNFVGPATRIKGATYRVEIRAATSGDAIWVAMCNVEVTDAMSVGT